MDTKKNLKPELKEIYERVMNTKATARTSTPAEQTPHTPQPSNEKNSEQPTPAAAPAPQPVSTPPSEPFLASSAPRAINDSSGFVFSSHGKNLPQKEDKVEKKEPAPPAQEVKKEATPEKDPEKKSATADKKKSNLLPIVLVLMAVFIGIYTVFWAFFLGII